jgi:hypothetical protein
MRACTRTEVLWRGGTTVSARAEELRRGHRGGKLSSAALLVLGWLHGGDGEVEGVKAGLWAEARRQQLTSSASSRWRGRLGAPPWRARQGRGGNGEKLGVSGARGDLACASWPRHRRVLATRRAPPVPGRPLSRPSSKF